MNLFGFKQKMLKLARNLYNDALISKKTSTFANQKTSFLI